jgi:adenylate cyclase
MGAGGDAHPPLIEADDRRRLIAIVYADMIGYSRLIGLDDAGTLARLQQLRRDLIDPALSRHGGTLVNTGGDSLLMRFDSILSAMRFSVEVQRAVPDYDADHPADRRIRFRVGVNVGDVIAEGTTLHGDGTNIAARLQTLCPPGAICVSRIVRDQVGNRLDLPFRELGAVALKNIGRPIEAFVVDVMGDGAALPVPVAFAPRRMARRRATLLAICGLAVCVAGGGAAWLLTWPRPASTSPSASALLAPGRQSIAVMPLLNIGGGDDYFAEGLTEDLIAALGRFPEIAVRARSAVIAHKDESPQEIAAALMVRYIVEGSVRRAPDRLRIDVRLIGTEASTVLWSETYDAEPKDVFAVQDDITRRIVGALSVRLDTLAVASAMAKPPSQLEAYDLVLRGRHSRDQGTRAGVSQARTLFEQAVALDPAYAAAYVGLALTDVTAVEEGWTGDPQGTMARAIEYGRKAVSLQDDNATAHAALGLAYSRADNYTLALDELRRAIELNPSDPEAIGAYGDVLSRNGDAKAGVPFLEEAKRFRPNRPRDEFIAIALAYFLAGRTEDAARAAEEGKANVSLPMFSILLAMSYAELGRTADAAREAANVKRLVPGFDDQTFGEFLVRPEDRERVSAALRRANL